MTSINGYAERRPGFALSAEVTPTAFNNLQRMFLWDRFDGTFIEMACDVNSLNQAQVYKRVIGSDDSFVSIFTDTGSSNVFDFAVSNNQVYFSNAHVAKKWDPVNGLSNWGIAIGSVNNATGPNAPASGVDGAEGFTAWTNPGNIKVEDGNFATIHFGPGGGSIDSLQATQFGFSIPATTTITGIQVDVKGQSTMGSTVAIQLIKGGSFTTINKSATLPASNGFVSLGGSSDLWGTTWVANDINQTTFGCAQPPFISIGAGGYDAQIDFIRMTVYGLGGPAIAVSASAGTFSATIGYQYVFCYGNSATGHISSPSPVSASTGIFTNRLNVQITLTASTDPQVNQIHLFRSTDSVAPNGTAGTYFELPSSPYPNTTANVTDNAADTSLNIFSLAPILGFNDPPTPFFQPVYFSGRFWGFKDNRLLFSGLEETLNGVPEESFPSGVAGNFFNFDQPIQALAVAGVGFSQTLMIQCGGRLYGITGTTLDTFRRFLISNRRGCRNRACVASLGGMVAWLDSSMQIWGTDGNSLQELSVDIRPDLAGLSPVGASMTFHTAGRFHWLVVSFPSTTFVFDMDLEQWMPPWNVTSKYIYSGETSAGVYDLLLSNGSKALKLSTTAHNDNGAAYTPVMKTNLFSVVPDFGKRFSYAAMGVYDEPSRTGYPTNLEVDTNNITLADVAICSDDDPLNPATVYTSVFPNMVGPDVAFNRAQGSNLVQNVFPMTSPEARWIGIKISGQTADDALKIYDFFLVYKGLGGR